MTEKNNHSFNKEFQFTQMEENNIDFKRYMSLYISNWYWFAISLFVALSIAYGINRYSEKIFTVSSALLIKDSENGGGITSSDNFMPGADIFKSQQNLNNEIGILKSFRLNKRVIDSLPEFRVVYFGIGRRNVVESRLYKNSPFKISTRSISVQPHRVNIYITLKSDSTFLLEIKGEVQDRTGELRFGDRFNESGFDFTIDLRYPDHYNFNPEKSNKYYFYFLSSEELANNYRGKLNVAPVDIDATLVYLSTSGFVVLQEVEYLNKLMELYINQGLEAKNQIADSTIKFIDRQLNLISGSLNEAEDNLQDFRLRNRVVDLGKEGALIQSRLEQLDNERTSIDLEKQYYKYLREYIDSKNESGDIVSPSVMGITDQVVVRLVQNLADLQKQKQELSMNFSQELPPLGLIDKNIILTKNTLLESVTSSLISLDYSLENVNNRIKVIFQEINKLPATERMLINIQRKFDLNNTIYTYLLEKKAEAGIAKASNVSDNRIIDEAELFNYSLVKPKAKNNNRLALLFGLLIPGIIISLLYYFNNRILDSGDVTKETKVPIMGYISHNENKMEMPVIENPGSLLSESFRSVRTNLRYFIKDKQNPVIAITSTISSEGKTFVSVNMAAMTALLGKKVLLIELDLRRPRIYKVLGMNNSEGLSTYLSNACEYEAVIAETSVKNLFYASSGPIPPNPAELIDGERMNVFIERARKEFDYIFIDTPPVAVVSDTLLLTKFTDLNIFVIRQRYSSKNTLEIIQELYEGEKLKNMGIIINDISLTGYYGYGLRYGYLKGYGYSYGKNYYGKYSYLRYGYSDKEHDYYSS